MMGKAKRHRKIVSGRKMVREALRKQSVLYAIQLAIMADMCRIQIGAIKAQRMKKNGESSGAILGICRDEILQPLTELLNKIASIQRENNISIDVHQPMYGILDRKDLIEKINALKDNVKESV